MNQRWAEIEAKRARLLERAAHERLDLEQALRRLERPLSFVDHCVAAVRYVIERPPLVAGAVLLLTLLRPRSALTWAQRTWGLWQGYRWLTRKLSI